MSGDGPTPGHRCAFEIMTGDDWGDGPWVESGYVYQSPQEALTAAREWLAGNAYDPDVTGVYVFEEMLEPDDAFGRGEGLWWSWSPQVPDLLYGSDSATENLVVTS